MRVTFYMVYHAPDPMGGASGGQKMFVTLHMLIPFDRDECWELFSPIAEGMRSTDCPSRFGL